MNNIVTTSELALHKVTFENMVILSVFESSYASKLLIIVFRMCVLKKGNE